MNDNINAFYKIKIRKLFIWFALTLLIYIFLLIFFSLASLNIEDPVIGEVSLNLLVYSMVFFWVVKELNKNKILLKQILGDLRLNKKILYSFLQVIPLLFFSFGALILFYYPLSFLFPKFVESQLNSKIFLSLKETSLPLFYNLMQLILAVLIAPLVEEIFFRGVLLHRFSLKWNLNIALIVSSLIFAILHADIIGSLVFGIVMGIAYIRTKTLWIPIIIHVLNNIFAFGVPFLLNVFDKSNVNQYYSAIQLRADIYLGIVFIAVSSPFLILYLYKNWPKNLNELPLFDKSDKIA